MAERLQKYTEEEIDKLLAGHGLPESNIPGGEPMQPVFQRWVRRTASYTDETRLSAIVGGSVVPGFFQTEAYAHSIMTAHGELPGNILRGVAVRREVGRRVLTSGAQLDIIMANTALNPAPQHQLGRSAVSASLQEIVDFAETNRLTLHLLSSEEDPRMGQILVADPTGIVGYQEAIDDFPPFHSIDPELIDIYNARHEALALSSHDTDRSLEMIEAAIQQLRD